MKLVFALVLLFVGAKALSAPYLSRQWSRSTLTKPHFEFRHLNRMEPLLTESLVIQGNGVDGIKAFNRKTGHKVWERSFHSGVEGGAALSGNKLYFGAGDGVFYCVDPNSGATLWTYKTNSESLTHPVVEGSTVYHVTGNNTLYAFNKDSGESLWVKTNSAKSNMTVRGQSAPVYENGVLYLGFSDGSFAAINAQNGRELWSKRIGDDKKFNDVDASAVMTPSCILVSSFANSLYCLNKSNGSIEWRHDVGGYMPVSVDENFIYYPTVNNEIHLLDLGSGKMIRKVVNVRGLPTEVTVFNDYMIYGETEGALVIRDKTNLQKVAEFHPGLGVYAKPGLDSKTNQVYIVTNDANIFRLDLREKPENPFLWSVKDHE